MKLTFDNNLFGLEPRDLKVYETMLLSQEPVSIRTLAASANLNRGMAFEIIKKLVGLGLVSGQYRGSRRMYRAEPPEALRRHAEAAQNALADELPKLQSYTRQLEAVAPKEPDPQFGRHYDGEEEIAALLRDVLTSVSGLEEKSYRVISSAEVSNHMYRKFHNFTRQRIKHGISVRVIGVGGEDKLAELAERKRLATGEVPASYIIIYGDKVAHISLTSLGDIQGSVTENAGVATLQKLLFDKLWESL